MFCSPDGVDGDRVGQLAVITRSNFQLFTEAVTRCVYSDSDIKVAFAGVCVVWLLFVVDLLLLSYPSVLCSVCWATRKASSPYKVLLQRFPEVTFFT